MPGFGYGKSALLEGGAGMAPGVEKGESHVHKQVPLLVHAYREHTSDQGGGPPSEQWC